ncbi:hypothetical protein Taro_016909 [Colocasia esculenta]|uniref:Uncharacterized protein n=1 Tax=Colocasia esculenta TaxID=4460 RepID=A0A843ULN5_COLES|nr:hypothetical protein [Colocasia esculenta]
MSSKEIVMITYEIVTATNDSNQGSVDSYTQSQLSGFWVACACRQLWAGCRQITSKEIKEITQAWGIPRGTTGTTEERKATLLEALGQHRYVAAPNWTTVEKPPPRPRLWGVRVSLASHWLSRELSQHRAN